LLQYREPTMIGSRSRRCARQFPERRSETNILHFSGLATNRQSGGDDGKRNGVREEEYSKPFELDETLRLIPGTKKHWSAIAISGPPVQPVLAGRRPSEPPVS
jgi:hypothetical protein